ncbi:hypothetical protein [Azospirillum sp. sgz301742]
MTDTRLLSTHAAQGFAAGFLAVLVFHQGMLGLLHLSGITARAPFSLQPLAPFGVPAVMSAAFWGGVWGIPFTWVERAFPRGAAYWVMATLFGALALTLVAWFVVAPLKGAPAGGGWNFPAVLIGPLVNGAWGFGTALLLRVLRR